MELKVDAKKFKQKQEAEFNEALKNEDYKALVKKLKISEQDAKKNTIKLFDSLEELYQLKKEFQNDFSDDLEKEECKIFLDSLNELEIYLKNKYLELNTIQNNLNDLIVKNNDKVKKLENYSNK